MSRTPIRVAFAAACAVASAAALVVPGASAGPTPRSFGGAPLLAGAARAQSALLRPDPTLSRPPASSVRVQPRTLRLSDEFRRTVIAHPYRWDWLRTRPAAGSRRIVRLHGWTEDGFPEVYVVLRARRTEQGMWWLQLRIPMRPNGTTGWVPRAALDPLRVVHTRLVVNRRTLRVALWVGGRKVWRAPVGVGKPSTPTPAGRFWVREGFAVGGQTLYGPYAFGTSAYSVLTDWPGGGVVGIHGTNQPYLVPGRPSHGCMRLHNADVSWLSRHMPVGTPILIL